MENQDHPQVAEGEFPRTFGGEANQLTATRFSEKPLDLHV